MKKSLLLYSLFLLLTGCSSDLHYDGQVRIIYEGFLKTFDGQPAVNVPVGVFISKDKTLFNYFADGDMISYTKSDANGYYRMAFPSPENADNISVLINYSNPAGNEVSLSKTEYYNIKSSNLSDYKLIVPYTTLYNPDTSVSLQLSFLPEFERPEKLNVTGMVDDNHIDINYTERDSYPNTNTPVQYLYNVAKNQVVTVQYLKSDGSIGEKQINVGEDNFTAVLEL